MGKVNEVHNVKVIRKVLIANRGEIAVRVAATLRALGVQTVAVASEADRDALHVKACDEVVFVGAAPASESYLVTARILAAAQATGADALHPGYGFLSENAEFAREVEAAGLAWMGPPPAAIAAMGNKIAAREAMQAAGVPVVPGVNHAGEGGAALLEAAEKIGFPVLVKAAAGGGGKGMRAVFAAAELGDAVAGAQHEAQASFGDATVYMEKLLVRPRHVEIQIFGDKHGRVVHLGERECSIQRRHQKVLEESPSPVLTPELRAAMGAAAVRAGEAVGYVGAGTVEFMLDESGSYYFLEMNTRLQVEHPVTEGVTGLDLVALQLAVAEGRPLPFAEVPAFRGHAIEARLYAEDPANGFVPQIGKLTRFRLPHMPGIRLDTGFAEGDNVSVYYDPMLAKLIAFGEDREQARRRLGAALDAWEVHGVRTNLGFLRALVAHPGFVAGETHTGFIAEHWPEGYEPEPVRDEALIALAVAEALGFGAVAAGGGGGGTAVSGVATWARIGRWRGGERGGAA